MYFVGLFLVCEAAYELFRGDVLHAVGLMVVALVIELLPVVFRKK